MARPLVVGNGKLLVNLDEHAFVRDIYYPYVGEYNHVSGQYCRLGIWVDNRFLWLDDASWEIANRYEDSSMLTRTEARHRETGIRLVILGCVHQRDPVFLRSVEVFNERGEEREVRLFFHQDLSISENEVGDTAAFVPENNSMVHYKRQYYFMFNGSTGDGDSGVHEYSTGVKRFNHAKGTWVDAEDGKLSCNPIAQGSVDSVVGFRLRVPGSASRKMHYWMTIGKNMLDVKTLDAYVRENDPEKLMMRVHIYWKHWVNKVQKDFGDLTEEAIRLYKLSLLVVRTQTDVRGAITAANDSDIMQFNRDHYSYVWPRDGAMIASAVSMAGYWDMVKEFFRFCADALSPEGYLHHKYNPDGTVGSSWHPFIAHGKAQLPIQVDETGLVLAAFWQLYKSSGDLEFAQSLYKPLIRKAGHFLSRFIDEELKLPSPSYDLWEERYGIFTYSVAAVQAGLAAASNFCYLFGDDERGDRFKNVAEEVKQAILTHLWDEQQNRFIRGLYKQGDKWEKDMTLESSVYGLIAFGVLPADDPRAASTMRAIEQGLSVKTDIGGIARYYNDYYFQRSKDVSRIPGNPWPICTLWVAEWQVFAAKTVEDLKKPREAIEWVVKHALPTGIVSEQVDPFTGKTLSVAPLTWSHAAYISTCVNYMDKMAQLKAGSTVPDSVSSSK
ncbi:glycoside hydrolase family 15 protein [Paenibacillus humicola]|uniref:glycoside hydrolase family 15 protein n=1 Tax=Paenibacillus humicola TaxID=3110540 RepID=UPI00237B98CD|nr:glycoside hydrolase family 15 protein [Paenibacillus humicola]